MGNSVRPNTNGYLANLLRWFAIHPPSVETMAAVKAISEKSSASNAMSGGCLIAFGSVFFLAGIIALYFTLIRPLYQITQAQSWVPHPAEITATRIDEDHDDDGTTYRPEIDFHYELDGQAFDSKQWSFSIWSGSRSWAESVLQRFPVGTKQTCYYNPNAPQEAVLDRSIHWFDAGGLFTLIFVIVGAGIMIAGYQMLRSDSKKRKSEADAKAARESTQRLRPTSSPASTDPWLSRDSQPGRIAPDTFAGAGLIAATDDEEADDDDEDEDDSEINDEPPPWSGHEGPQRLQPQSSRMAVFIGVLVMALFWNGISWVIFLNVLSDEGWLSFPGIFVSIFVLIGAGLMVFALYAFLALFNPKVTIALSNAAVLPGETVDVAWELEGNHQRIRQLQLSWVGNESATYTRGTKTTTDKHEFARIPIATLTDPEQIRFSSVEFTVPPSAIHSFSAPRNRIDWTIEVHGKIAWWPDLRESLIVYVKAQPNGTEP